MFAFNDKVFAFSGGSELTGVLVGIERRIELSDGKVTGLVIGGGTDLIMTAGAGVVGGSGFPVPEPPGMLLLGLALAGLAGLRLRRPS